MRPITFGNFVLALAILVASPPAISMADEPKTLKERLSDKASDEQRVDNCRVPVERRGSTPRPGCPTNPVTLEPPPSQAAKPH
jgi:hypothetical protein